MSSPHMTRVVANNLAIEYVIADSFHVRVNNLNHTLFNNSIVIVLVWIIFGVTITRGHPASMRSSATLVSSVTVLMQLVRIETDVV